MSDLERDRQKAKRNHIQASRPGQLFGVDTFLIGVIKGIDRVYHFLAVDTYSRFAIASVYAAKTAEKARDFLINHLIPKAAHAGVQNLLLDNGTEFTAARWRDEQNTSNHPFEKLARSLGIGLKFTKPRHPWSNGACERLHQTLLYEFYIPAFCSKTYTNIEELNYDLQKYLQYYNYERPNQSYRLKGKTPAEKYHQPILNGHQSKILAV